MISVTATQAPNNSAYCCPCGSRPSAASAHSPTPALVPMIALPLLAVGRAIWEFFADRVTLEPWSEQEPLPVELVEPRSLKKQ